MLTMTRSVCCVSLFLKYIWIIAKTSDRVGCYFSDNGIVVAKIVVSRQVLGFMLVRWVKHGGW